MKLKKRLDSIIKKARVDLYKPIQIAEVLKYSRLGLDKEIDIMKKETYQNKSLYWRNQVTQKLLNKISTSSARYQHNLWNNTAISPELLLILDAENKRTQGGVERYIYLKFSKRQETISSIITYIESANIQEFS